MRYVMPLVLVVGATGCGKVSNQGDADGGPDGGGPGPGPLMVVSTAPDDEATDVAPDAPITVVFSSPVRSESVTSETFALRSALGPVAGEFGFDGATVTFTPALPLHLLGRFDVELTTGISSEEAGALAAPLEMSFRVADGAWSPRAGLADDIGEYPLPAWNRRGDIVVAYATVGSPRSIKAVRFDSAQASFSLPELVENDDQPYTGARAAVNDGGDAIVTWSTDPAGMRGWARHGTGGWEGARVATGFTGPVAMTADGTAVIGSAGGTDQEVVIETLPGTENVWAASETAFGQGGILSAILQSDDRLELVAYDNPREQLIARGFIQDVGLTPGEQELTPTGITMNWVNFQYVPDADLTFAWEENGSELAGSELWYATFDGTSDIWSSAMLAAGSGGSSVCMNSAGARVAAFTASGSIFALHAAAGEGFSAPANLGSPSGIQYAFCAIDEWGNGHLFWGGFAGGKSFHARFADGALTDAVEISDGPWLNGVIEDPVTGVVRAIFYDSTGQKLEVRAFE